MDTEVVKSELVQVSAESGNEEINSLLHEKENGTVNQETGLSEPIKFGSHGIDEPVDRKGNNAPAANFPKDAVDEWPAPKQIHSFYLVKYRTYEDPKLKAKFEQADKDVQKKSQARQLISEKLRAKKAERFQLFDQMKPLHTEKRQFWSIMDEKKKEMEPLHQALGKLRSTNSVNREKGVALCSSEEELNNVIKSLHYRIQHESIPLSEEKKILKEIRLFEGTRDKVLANAAMRAKIQDSMGEKDVIQDQVKLMGVDLDGVRKDQQVIKAKLNQLDGEKNVIEKEIKSLEAELEAAWKKQQTAYETFHELRKQLNEGNNCFRENREILTKARELAAKKDIEALKEICNVEVDKFMSLWNSNKACRDDYERRILASLDYRQLSRDGRMRNPDEKPLVIREAPPFSIPETVAKTNVKQPKEDSTPSAQHDTLLVEKVHREAKNNPQKEAKNKVTGSGTTTLEPPIDMEDKGKISGSEKPQKDLQSKQNEVDEAKLKEMRREEEIAKAKQALERKKKLAEKAAAKAAVKAQKEAEKKLKEREKKAKKKAVASAPASEPDEQPTEADAEVTEQEKADENVEAPVPSKIKDRKESAIRYRNRPKGPVSLPRDILKRKKSTNYWVWAAPAALSVLMLLVIGYKYFF